MKCHKLEVYGLLESNKIYIFFASFMLWLNGDDSEEEKTQRLKYQKAF